MTFTSVWDQLYLFGGIGKSKCKMVLMLQSIVLYIWSLRKSNQHILEEIDKDPGRFFIVSWAPQLRILQHKATIMAILHGGMNGIHEALYSGVPIVL